MVSWKVFYHETAEKELSKLPPALQVQMMRLIDLLELHGPHLGMPLSRQLQSGLYEVRAKAQGGIARGIYTADDRQKIIMLKFFQKKQQKLARHILETAIKRMKKTNENPR